MNAACRDLIVVGGGPSGLAAAIHGALQGMSVTVVEPHAGTIDKACGEGLMPGLVDDLAAMGCTPERSRPFDGIRYLRGDDHADGHFPDAPGLGVRRLVLHTMLRERAEALGVVWEHRRAVEVTQDEDGVTVDGLRGRWLIAADGLRSPIRSRLGLDAPSRWPDRFGLRQHFAVAPWSHKVEVYWSDDVECYVTPVDDDLVGVAFLYGDRARVKDRGTPGPPWPRLLRRFPALAARLTEPASEVRGAGPFAQASRQRVAGRVFLVGDAAGYLDPLTGEGLKLGVRTARDAVDAIVQGRPDTYERAWRGHYRPYALATGGLLWLTRPVWARRLLVPAARTIPGVMDLALRVLAH